MINLKTFELIPLKREVDQVSGLGIHVFDPEGESSKVIIDINHIVFIREYDKENNAFEITFELGSSYRPVVVKAESIELLKKEIN